MNYLSRSGETITREKWVELYRQRDYSVIRHTRIDRHEILTSWIGIQHQAEAGAKLFLVQTRVKLTKPKEGREYEDVAESWWPSERLATVEHQRLEKVAREEMRSCGKVSASS
jgi:hypothetical protein